MSQIEEVAAQVGGNVDQAREVAVALAESKEKVDELAAATADLGMGTKATEVSAIGEDLNQVAEQQTALAEQIEQIRARLQGLQHGASAPGTPRLAPTPTNGESPPSVGRWVTPPKRNHGNEFNKRYEQWVKTSNGGPDDDREYLVRGAWFDARRFETAAGGSTEVLIDAKGRYDKFISRRTGNWEEFFSKFENSGVQGLVKEAKRQVKAAGGQPVEWWCAERDSARLLRKQFRLEPRLNGRIKVRYMPMPEEGKLPL